MGVDRHYTVRDGCVLFWGSHLSNWALTPFRVNHSFVLEAADSLSSRSDIFLVDQEFNCGEQFMMYMKARISFDQDSADKILKETNPRKQKALGRQVKNFRANLWTINNRDIMYIGLLAKYEQNLAIKHDLLSMAGKIIAEASPHDSVWGIGLAEDHPDATDPNKWKGENRLGQVLMKVLSNLILQEEIKLLK